MKRDIFLNNIRKKYRQNTSVLQTLKSSYNPSASQIKEMKRAKNGTLEYCVRVYAFTVGLNEDEALEYIRS